MNTQWIRCPICGNKTRDRLREDTVLTNYPLYCPKCTQETLPLGKIAVVLLYNGFRFSVGCHKRLHIGITVFFQNIGQLIQSFGDFLFGLPYLLGKGFSFLTLEVLRCLGKLCFQLGQNIVLQISNPSCLVHDTAEQIGQPAAFAVNLSFFNDGTAFSDFPVLIGKLFLGAYPFACFMAKGSARKKGKKWYRRFYIEDESGRKVQVFVSS